MQNYAAGVGTAVHGGLEAYVDAVYVQKTSPVDFKLLEIMYFKSYQDVFGNSDDESEEYLDGLALLIDWFDRTDLSDRKVVSVEKKYRYPIPLSDGSNIPLSFIFDRLDLDESTGEYTVNDYKTNQAPMGVNELKGNTQAKIYALMVQIDHPETPGVWVSFDMLRNDGPVTVYFTKAENEQTWFWLINEVGRILETDEKDVKATLNAECGWCVLKSRCPKILDNIKAQGVFGLSDQELVDRRALLDAQAKAAKSAVDEIDLLITPKLETDEGRMPGIDGTEYRLRLHSIKRRTVDPAMAERVNPDVFRDYVKPTTLGIGDFDRMLKDDRLTPEEIKVLKSLVQKRNGRPTIRMEKI